MVQDIAALGVQASISAWVSRVVKEAASLSYPGVTDDKRQEFKGDALEILTEYLMKVTPVSPTQGMSNYKCVKVKDDYGVDALGLKNGNMVVLQCKFRENPLEHIHYADLARTFTQGVLQFGLDPKEPKGLWLVTTAYDANINSHYVFNELGPKLLHVLALEHLSYNLDGNIDFWQGFLASIP